MEQTQEDEQRREHGATLEALPTELKVAILTHLPGTVLASSVVRVNSEWRQLARTAVLQRAAERRADVVALQRWWRAKREAALAHGVNERMSAIELAIDTAERVIEPKLACLAARRQLLDLLASQHEDQQEAERSCDQATEPAAGKQRSLIGGMWAAIRGVAGGGKSEAAQPAAAVRFTRELVEAMLPEQLLLDLVAPFERFIADARAALLLWKGEHSRSTAGEATQAAKAADQEQPQKGQEEDVLSAQNTTTATKEEEVQMFGPLLIRLLDESMRPIVAYLTYLETEHINQRIVLPLCQGADLDADAPYWAIMAYHFKQPPLYNGLNSVPAGDEALPFGSVRPARQRAGTEAVAINTFALVVAIGWGSMIVRLGMAIDTLDSRTLARHPDRRNIKGLVMLKKMFFARLESTSTGLVGTLCYD